MSTNCQTENLRMLWKQFDDYFRHKEILCYYIVLAEIALFSFFLIAQPPVWFNDWNSNQQGLIPYLAVFMYAIILSFLGLAHFLLLFQLRQRRVADAWADGIRFVLAKWAFQPPTEAELKPLCEQQREAKFIAARLPKSNADSLWPFVPSVVAEAVYNLLTGKDKSFGSAFERIVASVSLLLFFFGVVVLLLRSWTTLAFVLRKVFATP